MSELIIKEKLTVEERLERLENMLVHLHGHLENLSIRLEEHDIRLLNLDILLKRSGCTSEQIDDFTNPKGVNYESYSPINEEDRIMHDKSEKGFKNELKELFGE